MRPRTAGIGIVACVLFVGAFENQEREHIFIRTHSLSAPTSGEKPLDPGICAMMLGVPRESITAVYNVSSWNAGGWPYWRTICQYIPVKVQIKKVAS